jgi:hypothetical protein
MGFKIQALIDQIPPLPKLLENNILNELFNSIGCSKATSQL